MWRWEGGGEVWRWGGVSVARRGGGCHCRAPERRRWMPRAGEGEVSEEEVDVARRGGGDECGAAVRGR